MAPEVLAHHRRRELHVEADGRDHWRLNGTPPHLDGRRAEAPAASCVLEYDDAGLVTRYPGIAVRHPLTTRTHQAQN
ncbi:hypothetical protein ABJI51_37215 [Amycolatopsis sp. NEAU-NG30]|uniref:Uncharacterized protein n=1 Tax=Amycolatopsis melonis TaxID=3156488 RepID=A0ABV0LR29_9PSEU